MHEEMKLNIEISDDEDDDDGVATNSAVKIRTNRRHTDRSSRLQQLYYCLVANQSFRAVGKCLSFFSFLLLYSLNWCKLLSRNASAGH